jgi:hypothetical protein
MSLHVPMHEAQMYAAGPAIRSLESARGCASQNEHRTPLVVAFPAEIL